MSCPQIWKTDQEKDRENEKVGEAKLNEREGVRDLEREINNNNNNNNNDNNNNNLITYIAQVFIKNDQMRITLVIKAWKNKTKQKKTYLSVSKQNNKNI